tara:strand:+ start:1153 stop:1317 length:165 start_codon:yes stop_codon:yes gene_type:complete
MNTYEAAIYLGVSHNTLRLWRRCGKGPKFISGGGKTTPIVYKKEDLKNFKKGKQ